MTYANRDPSVELMFDPPGFDPPGLTWHQLAVIRVKIGAGVDLMRDYSKTVIDGIHLRALSQMTLISPGRDVVLWIDLVSDEAELVAGIETLIAYGANGPKRTQGHRAVYAEWLTKALADGPHRPFGLKAAFHSAHEQASRKDWEFLEHMAQELGFVQGDLWQLPDDHPWVQLGASDVV